MRTVTATLRDAPKGPSPKPYLEVKVLDQHGAAKRLVWSLCYSGAEPDSRHAATMPGDGSLIRLRLEAGTLFRQRVTAPT